MPTRLRVASCAAILLLSAASARANDGFAGVAGAEITFSTTDAVTMAEEDLFISEEEVRVAYVFRNDSGADVSGTVAFPMPAIPAAVGGWGSDFGLDLGQLDEPNFMGFTVLANGQPVTPDVTIRAFKTSEDELYRGSSGIFAQTGARGPDVTDTLTRAGLPLTVKSDALSAALGALSPAARQKLVKQGLLAENPDGPMPLWSIAIVFSWSQDFPAGQEVRLSHRFKPINGAFVFGIYPELRETYCIDAGTEKGIRRLAGGTGDDNLAGLVGYTIDYVLTTANTWAGPIGKFRLTVDKGAPANILSLCADGITKVGPTTFVLEKTDYTPDRELQILIVKKLAN